MALTGTASSVKERSWLYLAVSYTHRCLSHTQFKSYEQIILIPTCDVEPDAHQVGGENTFVSILTCNCSFNENECESGQRGTPTVVQTCGCLTTVRSSFGELPQRDRRYLVIQLNAHVPFIINFDCLGFWLTLRLLLSDSEDLITHRETSRKTSVDL